MKRTFQTLAACLVLLLAVEVNPVATDTAGAQETRPNILIIMSDDQRAHDTMHMMPRTRKWFRRQGVSYPRAYATTPQCCPSRASIMTGRYAHNHRVENNDQVGNLDHSTTLQRYLQEAGYRTGLIGKFLNGWSVAEAPPYFDDFLLFKGGYYNLTWNANGKLRDVPGYSTDIIKRAAVRFIRKSAGRDQPWMLYVNTWAPHMVPIVKEKRRFQRAKVPPFVRNPAMREADCSDKPPYVTCRYGRWRVRPIRRKQLRTLVSVDLLVDRVMKVLGETGDRSNTLAFYMSDNGFLWGEHGLIGKKPPYLGGIEIPLLMRYPGRVEEGTVDRRFVANIDVPTTAYDAADVAPGVEIDGRSLLDPSWERDRMLLEFDEHKGWPRWASLLTRDLHYIEYYEPTGVTKYREYYDLVSDPWELQNLLGDEDTTNDPHPVVQADLQVQLQQDRRCSGDDCP